MATYNENRATWWDEVIWNKTAILCEELQSRGMAFSNGIWSKESSILNSDASLFLFQHALIMAATSMVCFLLKPLRMPYIAQMIGGVLIGLLFPKEPYYYHKLLPPTVIYLLKIFSLLGFFLHSFLLGVETNMSALRRIGKRAIIISFSGFLVSGGLSYATYRVQLSTGVVQPKGLFRMAMLNAQTFFMVTCTHTNELGISNSDIGRLAASTSMALDVFGMLSTFVVFNVVMPLQTGGSTMLQPLIILGHYTILFAVFRPLVLYIVSKTPEGSSMKQSHFVSILSIALVIACLGELTDHRFSLFLFALTLPEEPLTTILVEKLDSITSGVFFPIYCALVGLQTNVFSLSIRAFREEIILLAGYIGKFIGTLVSSIIFGIPFWHAFTLSLVISSKGLFDIVTIFNWNTSGFMDVEEYTLALFHILALTGGVLPLVRCIYEPSGQYSTILRQTVMTSSENGTFPTLVCIFKERNTSGIVRLLEAFHPSRARSIPVAALQLLQLTGRASFPIMAPLHQVKSSATFRSNLERCNRIVNLFLKVERETKGYICVQHYISVATYETMHNDICNLAYEKNVSLLIIPFHTQWSNEGFVEDTSLAMREINKMVLEKAPCSVGLLVERDDWSNLSPLNGDVLRIAILFIGGIDDHEALAYTKLFGTHPNIRVMVVWLKPSNFNKEEDFDDWDVMTNFVNMFHENESVSFREVVADDGSETTQFLVTIKDAANLVIVGRNHDPNCAPVFGLSEGWTEYPELGILGSMLATPDFEFSILVVQQEPQDHMNLDNEESILI